ncbi:plasma membrane ATPase 4 [Ceratobasidium sp. AG-Ba]|nr:plasma membrane ATPase 4 [Ceratobasidium sp. AG-Ba]
MSLFSPLLQPPKSETSALKEKETAESLARHPSTSIGRRAGELIAFFEPGASGATGCPNSPTKSDVGFVSAASASGEGAMPARPRSSTSESSLYGQVISLPGKMSMSLSRFTRTYGSGSGSKSGSGSGSGSYTGSGSDLGSTVSSPFARSRGTGVGVGFDVLFSPSSPTARAGSPFRPLSPTKSASAASGSYISGTQRDRDDAGSETYRTTGSARSETNRSDTYRSETNRSDTYRSHTNRSNTYRSETNASNTYRSGGSDTYRSGTGASGSVTVRSAGSARSGRLRAETYRSNTPTYTGAGSDTSRPGSVSGRSRSVASESYHSDAYMSRTGSDTYRASGSDASVSGFLGTMHPPASKIGSRTMTGSRSGSHDRSESAFSQGSQGSSTYGRRSATYQASEAYNQGTTTYNQGPTTYVPATSAYTDGSETYTQGSDTYTQGSRTESPPPLPSHPNLLPLLERRARNALKPPSSLPPPRPPIPITKTNSIYQYDAVDAEDCWIVDDAQDADGLDDPKDTRRKRMSREIVNSVPVPGKSETIVLGHSQGRPYSYQRAMVPQRPRPAAVRVASHQGRTLPKCFDPHLDCAYFAPSPSHPSARDNVGSVAARPQSAELAETLCPFQLLYADGVERLGTDTARERGGIGYDRAHAGTSSYRALSFPVRVVSSTVVLCSILELEGSSSTHFVPPFDNIPAMPSTLSRQSSFAMPRRAADDMSVASLVPPARTPRLRRTASIADMELEGDIDKALNRSSGESTLMSLPPGRHRSGAYTPTETSGQHTPTDRPLSSFCASSNVTGRDDTYVPTDTERSTLRGVRRIQADTLSFRGSHSSSILGGSHDAFSTGYGSGPSESWISTATYSRRRTLSAVSPSSGLSRSGALRRPKRDCTQSLSPAATDRRISVSPVDGYSTASERLFVPRSGSQVTFRCRASSLGYEFAGEGSQGPSTYGTIGYEICERSDMSKFTIDQTESRSRSRTAISGTARVVSLTKGSEEFITAEGSAAT